jgi:hypothetical protein
MYTNCTQTACSKYTEKYRPKINVSIEFCWVEQEKCACMIFCSFDKYVFISIQRL